MLGRTRRAVVLLCIGLANAIGCSPGPPEDSPPPAALSLGPKTDSVTHSPAVRPGQDVRFVDATPTSGLDFVHVSGTAEQRLILESMSGGAAFLDYDADGYLDLYLVSGTRVDAGATPSISRLYRNIPATSPEHRRFTDVTAGSGVGRSGWAMGCAATDYDNDGDTDLYVTHWGANILYENSGDGRFTDASARAGVGDEGWGASAAFGDLDADGWLDLYVANYVEFDLLNPPNGGELCEAYKGIEGFCGPKDMEFQADVLYRNSGGRFEDVSTATGVANQTLPGLGVVFADYDDDGDQDVYVANDTKPNLLWRNDGDWQLREVGTAVGAAYDGGGKAQSGMGVDWGDYDNDGDLDIFVTNFAEEFNTLYQNEGDGTFNDATGSGGLAGGARPLLGWSTAFFDADNDGWLDLFVANGHLYPGLETGPTPLRYPQRNLFYWNDQSAYVLAGRESGSGLEVEKVSRGAAFGDYDNDGDVDILIVNLNDIPTLLRNDGGNSNNWLGLQFESVNGNREAIGARVQVSAGGRTQTREVRRSYGYQSAQDPRLLFGLGTATKVDSVVVRWPSGRRQTFPSVSLRQYHRLREGQSEPAAAGVVP